MLIKTSNKLQYFLLKSPIKLAKNTLLDFTSDIYHYKNFFKIYSIFCLLVRPIIASVGLLIITI